jgi:hypothetical protein
MSEEAQPSSDPNASVNHVSARAKPKKLEVPLPYLASPGTVKTAFDRLRNAATPDRVNPDFVNAVLQIKGGTGNTVAPFLKRIGLVASDGAPTELYKRFRNQTTGGAAIASAIKHGYRALGNVNEYFYRLDDKGLLALIVQVTGTEPGSSIAKQILYTLNALKQYADFDALDRERELGPVIQQPQSSSAKSEPSIRKEESEGLALNLAYTINLNLPATSDQAVFNAIFKSLKEHLLSHE